MDAEYFNFTPPVPFCRLIGHRGLAARAPENTMASFKLAAAEKIDWVELDVQLSSDHTLMIFHDDELERTTNGQGMIYEKTVDQLLRLDAGSWFSPAFAGEKIPMFASALPELLKLGLYLNIELKVPSAPPPGYIPLFALIFSNTLRTLWPLDTPKPLISSFDWTLLRSVRASLPEFPVGYLTGYCTKEMIDEISTIHNAALHCDHEELSLEDLAYAKAKNVPILAYTVEDPRRAFELLNKGAFALFSDDPTELAKRMSSTR